jgi:hypothetical protein
MWESRVPPDEMDQADTLTTAAHDGRYAFALKWRFLVGLILFGMLVAVLWRPVVALGTILWVLFHVPQ